MHHPDASDQWFESESAIFDAKFVVQVYCIGLYMLTCFRCDLVMSLGERDSLCRYIIFQYLLFCFAFVSCTISKMAGQNMMKMPH